MWSVNPTARMAPQASDCADRQELLDSRHGCLPERAQRVAVRSVVCGMKSRAVGRNKIWQTLDIWRCSMDLDELLHPLSSLLTGVVFAFCLVFSLCGSLQGAGRDQPKIRNPLCSTLWAGFRLTFLHTVLLWPTMRCPMILGLIGRPSARTSGVCLFRENTESLQICGTSPEKASTRGGLSTDEAWVMAGYPPGYWP